MRTIKRLTMVSADTRDARRGRRKGLAMHWMTLWLLQEERLRDEREYARRREAYARASMERAGRSGPDRRPRRWTLRAPRLAVTITLDPEAC